MKYHYVIKCNGESIVRIEKDNVANSYLEAIKVMKKLKALNDNPVSIVYQMFLVETIEKETECDVKGIL